MDRRACRAARTTATRSPAPAPPTGWASASRRRRAISAEGSESDRQRRRKPRSRRTQVVVPARLPAIPQRPAGLKWFDHPPGGRAATVSVGIVARLRFAQLAAVLVQAEQVVPALAGDMVRGDARSEERRGGTEGRS